MSRVTSLSQRLKQPAPSESQIVPAELHRLIRALELVWRRLGSARVYVAAIAGAVVILAAIGISHLVSSAKPIEPSARNSASAKPTASPATKTSPPSPSPPTAIARISPGAQQSLSPAAPTPAPAPAEAEGKVQVTKLEQTEKRGRHGETFVVATIGLASRADVENSGGVEIHVYFYDLTPDNEIRPTDAQVTYQWLTPVRDWSDPAPKFLEATYFKRSRGPRSFERLRYGGFVVRVFSGGKLQDEQSQPQTLLALFRNKPNEPASGASAEADSSPPAREDFRSSPVARDESPPPSARTQENSQQSTLNSQPSDHELPYGKPIPGKPGFLYSPYDEKFIIDVRGFPPGTLVNDPNTNKPFRVP